MDSTANSQHKPFSIKLWPPSESTRQVLVQRLTNNFTSNSIFTQKYGALNKEEAEENAKKIEDVAFNTANEHYDREPDGDGGAAVQLYAKECSKLLLEALKRGPAGKEELASQNNASAETLSFGQGAARVAGPILASLKNQLKEADLSDFIAGRPVAEALEVMNIFSTALEGSALKSLNISNNALGEKGVRAFGALLKSVSCLEELYLMNDGISEEAARAVCELIPSAEKLKVLHFHNNMTGDEGARAISDVVKCSSLLEDFRCSSTRIGSAGGIALSKALKSCTHLKKLDLRDNMFGVEAGVALSKALSKHLDLVEVYLSYLNLEDEGVVVLANALKESAPSLAHLTKLNLAENELKDEGTIQISKALEEGHTLLKEVDMSNNFIRRVGARHLARIVVEKPGFVLLNINGNIISDDGVDELKETFKKSPDMLGPLDENDPEGEEDDDEEESGQGEADENELETKMKNLEVGQEE
ncbi:RAN GTPase-activating protein 2 [Hibiscus syriacus]|uniref:RAN GTPase-activating protein 2 n=1 Tax=Hibiscus syriacus TaxID=106335 RepID=A0A6A2YFP4_HIBSY|nr:RAN GTPase-activating protein 2 [Hibiscus syriacus]